MSVRNIDAWKKLKKHAGEVSKLHLRNLMQDGPRCRKMMLNAEGITLDFSRQNATQNTMNLLLTLAKETGLKGKINAMFKGQHINCTEDRAVLHTALRAPKTAIVKFNGKNVMPDIHAVLDQVKDFSDRVRNGRFKGSTGKKLIDVVAIGIGGSYLGPEFVYEAMRGDKKCVAAAKGRRLRFLANVDPIDVSRALEGLNPETTLVIIVSKTFTTAETILNATTVRNWIVDSLGEKAVAKHMVAVSTNLEKVAEFGINPKNTFGFWDWVGGRYSVCSAVGVLPLALQYGFKPVRDFLDGAYNIDVHFAKVPLQKNLPVLLGLLGVWNSSFLGRKSRALLPYCQGLLKLAPHIQQVDMESNGKRVDINGKALGFDAGEIDFGEPGTNGQHSFYQLMHQGQVVPADFIGFRKSQQPIKVKGHPISNHDELMANFFAQPDALALGKTEEECIAEGIAKDLVPHKVFPGNRPSVSLMLEQLTPYSCGQLLALYEHRTAVQGFIWNLNSFDQMGVELGKVLAKQVVSQFKDTRKRKAPIKGFNPATTALMKKYLDK